MSDFAEEMSKLLSQLDSGQIDANQFKTLSAKLVDTVGETKATSLGNPVQLERVDAAEKLLREL